MSPVGECIPFYEPGERITVRAAGAAVNAGRFLKLSGTAKANGKVIDVVHAAAAADAIIGVAGVDIAAGATGVMYAVGDCYVVPMTAGAAVALGQSVTSGAAGKAVPTGAGEASKGRAWTVAGAADVDVMVQLGS